MSAPREPTPYIGPNTLQSLALDQCRYTDSTTKPFVFCGAPVASEGGPYCAEHRAICYVNRSSRPPSETIAPKTWKTWQ